MSYSLTPDFISRTIGRIYDCALDPSLWPETLCSIRDEMDLAYVHLFYDDLVNCAHQPIEPALLPDFMTPWDKDWMGKLPLQSSDIPGYAKIRETDIDCPISQLGVVPVSELLPTAFYNDWLAPQGLLDITLTPIMRHATAEVLVSAPTRRKRGPLTVADLKTFRLLAPHMRQALQIAELFDEGRLSLALHRHLLDQLSVAVFLVRADGKIAFHNAEAEAMLQERRILTTVAGDLRPVALHHRTAFSSALAYATTGQDDRGSGVALKGTDGTRAVAHFMPLGQSERRRALGPGHAAIFVSTSGSTEPPAVEVLSALTGMTLSEARIALAIAEGQSTEDLAARQGISIHTLRKHLSNAYEKTGLNTQTSLAALVNGFRLPIRRDKPARGNSALACVPN